MKFRSLLVSSLFAAALVGCDGDSSAPGSALVKFGANAIAVTAVSVSVLDQDSAEVASADMAYDETEDSWSGAIEDIEVGTYSFVLTATVTDAEDIVLTSANEEITEDGTTYVSFFYNEELEETVPVPFISSISASTAAPLTEQEVSLSVTAESGVGTLAYAWEATCGTFDPEDAETTTWTAPEEAGTCDITITVSDDNGSSTSVSFGLEVSAAPVYGDAEITFELTPAPTASYSVSNDRIQEGDETEIILSDVSPADSVVTWGVPEEDACSGTFSEDSGVQSTFTLGTPATEQDTCNVQVVISNGDATTTIIFQLGIAPHPTIS